MPHALDFTHPDGTPFLHHGLAIYRGNQYEVPHTAHTFRSHDGRFICKCFGADGEVIAAAEHRDRHAAERNARQGVPRPVALPV